MEHVNHPSHYNSGKIEVIDAIEDWGFGEGFNRGNAIKYIARAGKKDKEKEVEDLQKAVWYINEEIKRLTQQTKKSFIYESLLECYKCEKQQPCLGCPSNGIKLDILNYLSKGE